MGPLHGTRILELAGIGPVPFACMVLGDLGADVVRIERASAASHEPRPRDPLLRNRRSIALDLKSPQGVDTLLRLVEGAHVLVEGFRPGVAERMGIGPDICLARNPRLVYGRMTGWGQDGPLAQSAGHDINYIALAGVLHLIGERGGKPVPPLNLVGDFGGGGMLLAVGVLAALLRASRTGRGEVVDAAMLDGSISLLAMFFGFRAAGLFRDATGENFLGGGAPWYDTYATRDGRYVAIGALEPQFFSRLLEKLGLDPQRFGAAGFPALDAATMRDRWPALREAIAAAFLTRTQAEWCAVFGTSDACFAPVLTVEEAARHPHNVARHAFIEVDGVLQNAPAPRFGEASLPFPQPPRRAGEDTEGVLREAGFADAEIDALRAAGALG
jgi:alpha-methylacyl-CoA racemase